MAADAYTPKLNKRAPIIIDAEFSQYDHQSSRLMFRGLRLNQGPLGVVADNAETAELDFENGLWIFRGNVVVEAENTLLYCEEAQLTFINHQLTAAKLTGAPARFEQTTIETGQLNSGEAKLIIYELTDGTLELNENAAFSDGKNQVSGDKITYDLTAQHMKAGSGNSGPVKIVIEPPTRDKTDN